MRKICCFAGHSRLYDEKNIYDKLISVIEALIVTENTNEFWVGNYGAFDKLSAKAVRELQNKYPNIELNLVIPYLTQEVNEHKEEFYSYYNNILIADISEKAPRSLRIIKSNQYMVQSSEFVVCYVKHRFGGAAKTLEYAEKTGTIKIINLAEI